MYLVSQNYQNSFLHHDVCHIFCESHFSCVDALRISFCVIPYYLEWNLFFGIFSRIFKLFFCLNGPVRILPSEFTRCINYLQRIYLTKSAIRTADGTSTVRSAAWKRTNECTYVRQTREPTESD